METLKRSLQVSALAVLMLCTFAGCNKDKTVVDANPNRLDTNTTKPAPVIIDSTNATPIAQLLNELSITPEQKVIPVSFFVGENKIAYIDLNRYLSIVLKSGYELLRKDNRALSRSPIVINAVFMDKLGKMVRMNRPTVSNGRLLRTGGAYYLSITQDKVPIHVDYRLNIAEKISAEPFNLFVQDTISPGPNPWLMTDTTRIVRCPSPVSSGIPGTQLMYYYWVNSRYQYINCDYFWQWPDPNLIEIKVNLPARYNKLNTEVVTLFPTINSVTNLYGSDSSSTFKSGGGYEAPVGMQVITLSISKIDDKYFLGRVDTRLPNDGNLTIAPIETPLTDIKSILDNI